MRTHRAAATASLVQMLHVELQRSAPVRVEYWTDDGRRLFVDSEPAATHDIVLARLRPDRTYLYRIVGTKAEGAFTSGGLPPDLARVRLTARGTPTVPLVLLHLYDPHGFRGYAAVNAEGDIVWYWRTVDMALGAVRRANGHSVFMDRGRGLLAVRADGSVAHELPQDENREQHHDVIETPHGTLLFLAFDGRQHAGELLKGEAIWEWWPETGRTVRRWSSWDHLSPDRDRGLRSSSEWLHANSLALGPRGNVLVSFRFLHQVISISPDFARVEWRLGGVNATRRFATLADEYSGQHTARELGSNRLLLFDNGVRQRDSSRALELDLSDAAAMAVWQWRPARRNFSAFVGSARRLPNGNTLITFGMSAFGDSTGPIEVYEVNPNGETVWHLEVADMRQTFRAEPWPSIGSEYERSERTN